MNFKPLAASGLVSALDRQCVALLRYTQLGRPAEAPFFFRAVGARFDGPRWQP